MVTGDEEIQWAYLIGPCFQLENTAGKPLTGGYIEVYIAGTRDKYYCCSDFDGTLHPFQIPLDSLGSNIVLASPTNVYDIYVYNKFGSLVMSRYNVMCTNGSADISVTGFTSVISDGTLDVSVTGNSFIISAQELWDAVSGLVNDVQTVSSAVDSVSGMLDGKKDIQVPYIASGTNVQTITKITQDEQGVMTVEYSDIQAQNPLTPGQYVTIDNDVISVTGLQPEGDYLEQGDLDGYATEEFVTAYVEEHGGDDQVQSDWAQTDSQAVDYIKNKPAEKVLVAGDHIDITSTASSVEISADGFATEDYVVDYVDSVVSGLDPVDITSSDGTIVVSSTVSGSVKVFDLSVSGGQPVYFRGGETWVPVSGTTADFSRVKKFDGTIVPSDVVSGIVPLGEGLWAWDAIVDIYVGGHVNELVKCGIKGQAVGNGYDPDSETELLIDSTRPGVINSFTLTGLSRGGSNTHLAFTFTRENSSTSTMWVRMRRLSVYQVKGPGVSQAGGGGDYEAGYGIIINNNVISVNSALIPDIETVTNMIDASIDGLATEDYVTAYVDSHVTGGPSYTAGTGIDITNDVISVSGVAFRSDLVNADWESNSGLSEILNKPETVPVSAGSGIDISETASGVVISCTVTGGVDEEFVTGYVESQVTGLQPAGDYLVSGDLAGYATEDYVTAYVDSHVTGGSSTVYVDTHTGLKGDGSQSDPIAINYDTNTLSTAQGTETITFTSGERGFATIPGNSAMATYMSNHTVSITFQGITPVSQRRSPVQLTLSPADGQGGDLGLEVSTSIAANDTSCVIMFDVRYDIAGWSSGTWDPTKDWNLWLYFNDGGTYPQIPYGYATSEAPSDNYKLTVKEPIPSHSYSDGNKVLTVNSSNNTLYWNTPRYVPARSSGDAGKVLTALTNSTGIGWQAIEISVANGSPIAGNGTTSDPLDLNIDTDTLTVNTVSDNVLPMVNGYAQIYANTTLSQYIASNNITFTITGITPTSSSRTVSFSFTGGSTGRQSCFPEVISGGTIPANASSFSITVNARNYADWGDRYYSVYDWHIYISEDDGSTWPAIPYMGCSHNGPSTSSSVLTVKNPVPSSTSSDENKVLTVNSSGTPEWQAVGSSGVTEEFVTAYVESQVSGIPTYSAGDGIDIDNGVISLDDPVNLIAGNNINISVSGVSAVISSTGGGGSDPVSGGNCISVNSNVVSWITTAGITDIVSAASLPANPVSTVIYLIPEA